MPVQSISLYIRRADATLFQLGGYAREIRVVDGRKENAWHDIPGTVTAKLVVEDGAITNANRVDLYGLPIYLYSGVGEIFAGRVSSVKIKPKEQGMGVVVTIQGHSVDNQLSRGESIASETRLVATQFGRGISLAGIAPDPQGLGVSDEFILVLDSDTNAVKVFNRSNNTRNAGEDFTLAGTGREPAGIVFDGVATYWIVDAGTGDATAHKFAAGFNYVHGISLSATISRQRGSRPLSSINGIGSSATSMIIQGAANISPRPDVFVLDAGEDDNAWVGQGFRATNSIHEVQPQIDGLILQPPVGTSARVGIVRAWRASTQFFINYLLASLDPKHFSVTDVLQRTGAVGLGFSETISYMTYDHVENLYWGLNTTNRRLYAFTFNGSAYANVPGRTISLIAANSSPAIICMDGDNILVADSGSTRTVYSYNKTTKLEIDTHRFRLSSSPCLS